LKGNIITARGREIGASAEVLVVRTPFRVSFCGGGTDFPAWFVTRPGAVVSAAINRYCYLTLRHLPPFFDYDSRFVWSRIEQVSSLDEVYHPAIKGCLKFLGLEKPSIQLHHDADLPAQSGTGSSAAFTVSLLHALYAERCRLVTAEQLAINAMQVDQDVVGEVTGCQDHVAVACGGVNHIDFGPARHDFRVKMLPVDTQALGHHLMMFHTKQYRQSTASDIETIKWQGRPDEQLLRAQYELTPRCLMALADGDYAALGKVLSESWLLKRELAKEVSNSHVDDCYWRALDAGAYGAKLCGAGGGGILLVAAPPDKRERLRQALADCVYVPFGVDHEGSRLVYRGGQELG
jgi:D-glycero-alpha-D-manno-heptose-7-phosphate kinase